MEKYNYSECAKELGFDKQLCKNKEEAQKAAEACILGNANQGYIVQKHETEGEITIQWRTSIHDSGDYKTFLYHNLKKGDLCWGWNDGKEKCLGIFTGDYFKDTKPSLTAYKDLGDSVVFDNYEPIGINIFDKQEVSTPQPEIAKDTPVWVRDWKNDNWFLRYATGDFNENGKIICYHAGRTSNTAGPENYRSSWDEYSLTDPNNQTP
jgi:hypothetical protein